MTAEPQKAALRTVSDRVLELHVGPVSGPVGREALAPPSSIPILKQVSIREYNSPGSRDRFLRARVLLREPGRGDVRVVGRVVYIDLTALNARPPA